MVKLSAQRGANPNCTHFQQRSSIYFNYFYFDWE